MYENLTDKDLLSVLIQERQGERVAEQLLQEFPTLPHILIDSTLEELQSIKGVGKGRALQLKVCSELAKRLYAKDNARSLAIKSPEDVTSLLMPEMRFLRKEQFRIIILNTKNHILEVRVVSEGSLNASIVHPREVFAWAVKRSASGIICIHNHPSGDPEPSNEDIETTKRLVDAGNILGIKVLDHIIIGDGKYVSLKEKGLI